MENLKVERIPPNHLNYLRFFAATQVMLFHTVKHMNVVLAGKAGFLLEFFMRAFPGVSVFFMISGFLITNSFLHKSEWKRYAFNRFLRIYPALWVCLLFTLLNLVVNGFVNKDTIFTKEFVIWFVGQLTFFQQYTPAFFRGYGNGCPNGSLWTIPVEVSFYVLLPLLFIIFRNLFSKQSFSVLFTVLLCLSYILHGLYYDTESSNMLMKVFSYSLIPHFWYFALGSLFCLHFNKLYSFIRGRFLIFFAVYFVMYISGELFTGWGILNLILLKAALCLCVFSFAFSFPGLSGTLINREDISYGTYLYHMPVINIFLHHHLEGKWLYVIIIFILTWFLASLSWKYIEKPALTLKH